MNTNPLCLPPEYPLIEALYELQKRGEDYAVICKSKIPVGIISSKDILRIFLEMLLFMKLILRVWIHLKKLKMFIKIFIR